jgi:hypothetical protein
MRKYALPVVTSVSGEDCSTNSSEATQQDLVILQKFNDALRNDDTEARRIVSLLNKRSGKINSHLHGISEHSSPMHTRIRELKYTNPSHKLNEELLRWTLFNILQALSYLHDEVKVTRAGNLRKARPSSNCHRHQPVQYHAHHS